MWGEKALVTVEKVYLATNVGLLQLRVGLRSEAAINSTELVICGSTVSTFFGQGKIFCYPEQVSNS